MKTIAELVAEMKSLIAELEQHTGLPPKKEEYTEDTITFNFDNMNSGALVSHYEIDNSIDIISLSPTEITSAKF
jgi:hypothetical protein